MGTELLVQPEIEWIQAERELAIQTFSELITIVQETQGIPNRDGNRNDNHDGNHDEPAKES